MLTIATSGFSGPAVEARVSMGLCELPETPNTLPRVQIVDGEEGDFAGGKLNVERLEEIREQLAPETEILKLDQNSRNLISEAFSIFSDNQKLLKER